MMVGEIGTSGAGGATGANPAGGKKGDGGDRGSSCGVGLNLGKDRRLPTVVYGECSSKQQYLQTFRSMRGR